MSSMAALPASAQIAKGDAARNLAPGGRLRAAINLGNPVLAQRDAKGELTGTSVVLARALAQRLQLPLDLIPFQAAGAVFEALESGQWDIAFLAIEPERTARIDFSPPYVSIDGTYLVRDDSAFRAVADLDRSGVRIAVGRGAAYDLHLSRTLKQAELVRAPTSAAAIDLFLSSRLEAAAGVRQVLAERAREIPGLRVLEDRFQRIDQAIGVPRGRAVGAAYIRTFLDEMRTAGVIGH
jgi:polar amino acid transport system substrate-binding protein